MNTDKISNFAKKLREEQDSLIFVEKEITDLLLAISDYILMDAQDAHLNEVPKGHITLRQFHNEYYFIGETTLHDYCKHNIEFSKKCALFHKGMWYVCPIATAKFFYEKPLYKKRMDRIMEIEQKSVSCNK